MTNKVAFFYLHGTSPLIADMAALVGDIQGVPRLGLLTVPGLNGRTATWPDGRPRDDPFINLLDPNIFDAKKIGYPALQLPFTQSVNVGVGALVAAILTRPKGQKFMLGGYSQGAAITSAVELQLRPGGALHAAHGADYLGGVCFGNPRRQQDYRGEVGGTWSGAWDVPGSTSGGRGVFPANSALPRLTNCDPTKWIEFTHPGDIFSSTGSSPIGLGWSEATIGYLSLLNPIALLTSLALALQPDGPVAAAMTGPNAEGKKENDYVDAVGKEFRFGGSGHVAYPWVPPIGDPDNGLTSFQIAIKWLESKAKAYAVGADVLPPTPDSVSTAGWTTSLVPPAA